MPLEPRPAGSPDRATTRAIALLSATAFCSSSSVRICDSMLPDLAREFGRSSADTTVVISAFLVAYGLTQAFFGPLGDRLGKYRMVAWTVLACTLTTLACGLAGSLDMLVLARLASGFIAGGIIPVCLAWIGDAVPYEQRQPTLARFLFGQVFGVIAGQFIGGVFADTLGWRAAFVFLAGVFLVVGWLTLRESKRNASTFHRPVEGGVRRSVLGAVADVLRDPWARVILVSVFIEGMLVFGGLALVPSYLHERFGLSLTAAGGLTAVFGLGGLTYIAFAGYFVRRLGEVGLAIAGGFFLTAAWLTFALGGNWIWALPGAWMVGIGFYKFHGTLQTNATQMAPKTRGTAVSMFASALFLGQSSGVFLAARIMEGAGPMVLFLGLSGGMVVLALGFTHLLAQHHRTRRAAA